MDQAQSKYWVDKLADDIIKAHPKGELIVESGHSPSGNYHVGTLREILTASAITHTLKQRGREARHQDFVDDFDALRKIPANVSKEWEKYLGQPLYIVPDPFECHESYGAHFLADLHVATDALGIEMDVLYAHEEYPKGKFTKAIEGSLEKLREVKKILSDISNRELTEDWVPIQILSDSQSLREWEYTGWNKEKQTVKYRAADGSAGEVSYAHGRVKLDWRLDWPARWWLWQVIIEPVGRDHATKGGSFDTGRELVEHIFGGTAPYPVAYNFVNRVGQTKKMSKSSGDTITASAALGIMPPEILRFFILRSMPSRTLMFDEGLGLFTLIEEYAKTEAAIEKGEPAAFAEAYKIAAAQTSNKTISSVSFSHLVSVYQAAKGDTLEVFDILKRTGYEAAVKTERDVIERELGFVKNWLAKYAPESVKFAVQDKLPKVELSDQQQRFLAELASLIVNYNGEIDGQVMHDLIYEAKTVEDVPPAEAFQAIYRVVLGQDSGPKAGWFLASLDQDWLVKRLRLES